MEKDNITCENCIVNGGRIDPRTGKRYKKSTMTSKDSATRKPYLVQRLEKRNYGVNTKSGIDRYFSMDYMGSSEFEWGALPAALRKMRSENFTSWLPKEITVNGYTLWYVGPDELITVAYDFFKAQMTDESSYRLKERSYIQEALTKLDWTGCKSTYAEKYVGWWCIDTGMPFALFTTHQGADYWLKGLRDK